MFFMSHILPILFIYIPEALLTLSIPLALLGVNVNFKNILPMGAIFGIVMYSIGFWTGNYIIVMLVLYCLVVGGLCFLRVSGFYEIAICASISFSIVLMLEYICLSVLAFYVEIDPTILITNTSLRISVFAIQILLAFLIYQLLRAFKLSIFD